MAFEIENICFNFEDKRVIDSLSITLENGKFYGIIGPNGCGKSTFLDILIKHRKPVSGKIRYKGKNLSSYSKKELSKEIALVPQNFYINFPFTAKEIIMMGRYPHIRRFASLSLEDLEIVHNIMVKTGTMEFKNRFISELSGGERQRVVVARAFAQTTPILILDEATSNLDINHAISLLNIAKEGVEQERKTVIAVLQDINLAAIFCDYMIFMKDGRIKAHGPADEILNPDTIRTVFDVDARIYFETYCNANQVVFKR